MNDYEKVISKADFNKVWSESTTEDILNQFYYEHNDLRELLKENGNKEETIKRQQEVITQLTNNWNELEEDINNKIKDIKTNFSQVNGNYFNMNYVIDTYEEVLDKMNEIKEGNNVSSRD